MDHMKFLEKPEHSFYYPVLYVDEFWVLREHLIEINDTVHTLPLTLSYNPISLNKWQWHVQTAHSFNLQAQMGAVGEGDSDEFKRMLVETNPYLLGLTMVVSLLHTIFDVMAFKNDITFWKNKKSMEGLSVRTLYINIVMQFIIFLYLLDNETSWMILVPLSTIPILIPILSS
jgi:hypothetical protein